MFKGNDLKVKIFYGVCLVLLIVVSFLSYNNFEKNVASNYYLSLSGESENWEVKSYQIKFTPNEFAAGNGTLVTKKKVDLTPDTDYLSIQIYAVFENTAELIHAHGIEGPGSDLSKISIGSIKGGNYLDKNKKPITVSDINDIYMVVEWQDEVKQKRLKETIDLYNQENLLN